MPARSPCSFCRKNRYRLEPVMSAPDLYICDVCLGDLQRFSSHVGQSRVLTAQEEVDLAKLMERGDVGARQEIVECNLSLVSSIAKAYRDKGLPLLDLVRAGALGLGRASEKYDYRDGSRFSAYATVWIRQAIVHALPRQGA